MGHGRVGPTTLAAAAAVAAAARARAAAAASPATARTAARWACSRATSSAMMARSNATGSAAPTHTVKGRGASGKGGMTGQRGRRWHDGARPMIMVVTSMGWCGQGPWPGPGMDDDRHRRKQTPSQSCVWHSPYSRYLSKTTRNHYLSPGLRTLGEAAAGESRQAPATARPVGGGGDGEDGERSGGGVRDAVRAGERRHDAGGGGGLRRLPRWQAWSRSRWKQA